MKEVKKIFVSLLVFSLVIGCFSLTGWAEEKWVKDDPVGHGWSALDLIFARPFGVATGVVGSAIFVVSLPFTIPAGGVKEAAEILILKPFRFSFAREFPDDDI
ncbi:MAG: hypothetical protein HXY44_05695 [Syntrophaceae bacterium]|nr:hypothetical protein [Syntrophaceae bacterium]